MLFAGLGPAGADPGISERGGGGGHQWCGRRVTAPACRTDPKPVNNRYLIVLL